MREVRGGSVKKRKRKGTEGMREREEEMRKEKEVKRRSKKSRTQREADRLNFTVSLTLIFPEPSQRTAEKWI